MLSTTQSGDDTDFNFAMEETIEEEDRKWQDEVAGKSFKRSFN